ncbi:hypothetical protein ACFC1R_35240 [Kitasatospora sp. NPDC056138]|uniref:LppU/SCO3897 family protein n=1 Tax=Kitasatospora sp. NPDC056138 TaxID=3345724 RepID=UPI0035E11C96
MSTPPPNPFGGPPQGEPPNPYATPSAPGFPAAAPYGQPQPYGQQPYGQQPPGPQSYGQPQPAPGAPAFPPPPGPAVPTEKPRRRRSLWTLFGILGLLGVGVGFTILDNTPERAHVGDCAGYPSGRFSKVNCAASDAQWVVTARYSGTSTMPCLLQWKSSRDYKGTSRRLGRTQHYVLCLGRHTPGDPTPTVAKAPNA